MSSLGEGYATRCDEEGFGGIYGWNQSVSKDGEEKDVHGDAQGIFVMYVLIKLCDDDDDFDLILLFV